MGAAAVATMLAGSIAKAQPADTLAAGRALTIEEALSIAHRNNRDLAQAKARVAQAHTGVLQAWVALLPQVAAQGKYTHNYKEVTLDFASFAYLGQLAADTGGIVQAGAVAAGQTAAANTLKTDLNNLGAAGVSSLGSTKPIVIQKSEQLDGSLTATVQIGRAHV